LKSQERTVRVIPSPNRNNHKVYRANVGFGHVRVAVESGFWKTAQLRLGRPGLKSKRRCAAAPPTPRMKDQDLRFHNPLPIIDEFSIPNDLAELRRWSQRGADPQVSQPESTSKFILAVDKSVTAGFSRGYTAWAATRTRRRLLAPINFLTLWMVPGFDSDPGPSDSLTRSRRPARECKRPPCRFGRYQPPAGSASPAPNCRLL